MPLVTAYHRPASVDEALDLLRTPTRVPLAGGTTLNADRVPSDLEAVDLQDLGLDSITAETGGRVSIGATVTLEEIRRCDLIPDPLRDLARAEQPSTLRTLATVGGLVARAPSESLLLAALLAHDGRVELAGSGPAGTGRARCGMAELLSSGLSAGSLITAVSIDPCGQAAWAGTGRTPADTPIVGVYARRASGGSDIGRGVIGGGDISDIGGVSMAITGVAGSPVLVDASDPAAGLEPAGDFRGSREYRLHLAATLAQRVLRELAG